MVTVNMHEAKTNFSKIVNKALAGEEVIIAKSGEPLVTLKPYKPQDQKRVSGLLEGLIIINDDFEAPLPDDLQKFFNE